MKPETLEALKASIAKWERLIVSGAVSSGAPGCPLCQLFNRASTSEEKQCVGCPVFAKTGKQACIGTPYGRHAAISSWSSISNAADKRRRHALSEARFLRSLLPDQRDQ